METPVIELSPENIAQAEKDAAMVCDMVRDGWLHAARGAVSDLVEFVAGGVEVDSLEEMLQAGHAISLIHATLGGWVDSGEDEILAETAETVLQGCRADIRASLKSQRTREWDNLLAACIGPQLALHIEAHH